MINHSTYGINQIGQNSNIFEGVILGFPSRTRIGASGYPGTLIGKHAVIRTGTVIYCDVTIGDSFSSGHNVMIREQTQIGDRVSIGTAAVIEGYCRIGNDVNIQSMVYIPTRAVIEDGVFIGPNAVLTNDRYPPHGGDALEGPIIKKSASIGANATILPGVMVGEGALVAAGAIVTKEVPPYTLAIGMPARFRTLPKGVKA